MNHFLNGFQDEMEKAGVAAFLGGTALKNLLLHSVMNTKVSLPVLRRFLENVGDDFMASGFRHAILGKKVRATAGAAIGTVAGANPMYLYNTGWKYGKRVADTMNKVPGAKATSPFKVLKGADVGVSAAMKAAPIGGALTGGAYGYTTGKTKREPLPIKSILAGAATGGLLGKGVKHYGPHAPGPKQLKWVRKNVVDPVLNKSQTRTSRLLDAAAK
jgi:hypothetical protein